MSILISTNKRDTTWYAIAADVNCFRNAFYASHPSSFAEARGPWWRRSRRCSRGKPWIMSATSLSGLLKRSRASPRVNSCHLDLVILAPGPVGFCTQARRQMALPPCYAHQLPLPPSVSRSWVELCTRHQKRYHFLYPFFFFFFHKFQSKRSRLTVVSRLFTWRKWWQRRLSLRWAIFWTERFVSCCRAIKSYSNRARLCLQCNLAASFSPHVAILTLLHFNISCFVFFCLAIFYFQLFFRSSLFLPSFLYLFGLFSV